MTATQGCPIAALTCAPMTWQPAGMPWTQPCWLPPSHCAAAIERAWHGCASGFGCCSVRAGTGRGGTSGTQSDVYLQIQIASSQRRWAQRVAPYRVCRRFHAHMSWGAMRSTSGSGGESSASAARAADPPASASCSFAPSAAAVPVPSAAGAAAPAPAAAASACEPTGRCPSTCTLSLRRVAGSSTCSCKGTACTAQQGHGCMCNQDDQPSQAGGTSMTAKSKRNGPVAGCGTHATLQQQRRAGSSATARLQASPAVAVQGREGAASASMIAPCKRRPPQRRSACAAQPPQPPDGQTCRAGARAWHGATCLATIPDARPARRALQLQAACSHCCGGRQPQRQAQPPCCPPLCWPNPPAASHRPAETSRQRCELTPPQKQQPGPWRLCPPASASPAPPPPPHLSRPGSISPQSRPAASRSRLGLSSLALASSSTWLRNSSSPIPSSRWASCRG